jgi:UDP-N-acetylmuramate dehydrogenase
MDAAARAASLRAAGFRGTIGTNEPLAPHTTWRIGGPAELLIDPVDSDDLLLALRFAHEAGLPCRALGNGSNLLVSDAGVRGIVLRTRRALGGVQIAGRAVEAGGGASLPAVANLAAARGLAGLEFAAGIPGTVGGAVVMNAGWHEHEIGAVIRDVDRALPDGSVETWSQERCAFGYRTSALRGAPGIVLAARFDLAEEDGATVRARLDAYAASRRANQPTELPSCGSVFLKPPGDFAGRLIESAGLKGLRCGAIEVSPKHANFFVNLGGGSASDALALIERVEREVEARFGVHLTREVEVWRDA